MRDLSADYARALDVQALTGTGANGQLQGNVTKAVSDAVMNQTWTIASLIAPQVLCEDWRAGFAHLHRSD